VVGEEPDREVATPGSLLAVAPGPEVIEDEVGEDADQDPEGAREELPEVGVERREGDAAERHEAEVDDDPARADDREAGEALTLRRDALPERADQRTSSTRR